MLETILIALKNPAIDLEPYNLLEFLYVYVSNLNSNVHIIVYKNIHVVAKQVGIETNRRKTRLNLNEHIFKNRKLNEIKYEYF